MLRSRIYELMFPNGEVLAAYFLLLQLTGGEPSWAQALSILAMQIRGNGCVLKGFKGRQPFATVKERVFPRVVSEFGAIAADVAAVEAGGFDGQIWRHAEARKRLRGSALRLYPGLALDCAFGPGGAAVGWRPRTGMPATPDAGTRSST